MTLYYKVLTCGQVLGPPVAQVLVEIEGSGLLLEEEERKGTCYNLQVSPTRRFFFRSPKVKVNNIKDQQSTCPRDFALLVRLSARKQHTFVGEYAVDAQVCEGLSQTCWKQAVVSTSLDKHTHLIGKDILRVAHRLKQQLQLCSAHSKRTHLVV